MNERLVYERAKRDAATWKANKYENEIRIVNECLCLRSIE